MDPFVDTYLLYLLHRASQRSSDEFHAVVRARGLRVPEWRVLACLLDEDGQMITRLVELSFVEQSNLTKIVDQMALSGLVERRKDATDRRRVRIWLTEKGRKLVSGLVTEARAHEAELLSRLPAGLADRIKTDLETLIEATRPSS